MTQRIFIAGVHGVGKGFFADRLSIKLSLPSYSCSAIIKSYLGSHRNDKKVQNIDANQDVLVLGVEKLIGECSVLIDGHFCLTDINGDIQLIPLKTFEQLRIKAILLITATVELIADRLMKRDGVQHDLSHIQDLQDQEITHAEMVSRELGIPIMSCSSGDDLIQIIKFLEQNT